MKYVWIGNSIWTRYDFTNFFPHFGLNKDLNVVSLVLLPWSLAGFVLVLSSSSQLSIEMNSRRNFIFDAMGKFWLRKKFLFPHQGIFFLAFLLWHSLPSPLSSSSFPPRGSFFTFVVHNAQRSELWKKVQFKKGHCTRYKSTFTSSITAGWP